VPCDHRDLPRVPPEDQMRMVVSDAAGEACILPIVASAPEARGDRVALGVVKSDGWIFQRTFCGAAEICIVGFMRVGPALGDFGCRAELQEFPGCNKIGPGTARIVW